MALLQALAQPTAPTAEHATAEEEPLEPPALTQLAQPAHMSNAASPTEAIQPAAATGASTQVSISPRNSFCAANHVTHIATSPLVVQA